MSNWKSINTTYVYDGTFDGLLSIVFQCFSNKTIPFDIVTNDFELNIFNEYVNIQTNYDNAKRVYNGILKNISYSALFFVHNAFLSNAQNKELCILNYLLLGFKIGPKVDHLLTDSNVCTVQSLSKRVRGEAHKLTGLVRFMDLGGNMFYSKIHPDNNVIEILGNHFINRFPTMNFIIHDKNRNLAFLYNTKTYTIIEAANLNIKVPDEETFYQNLWKTFYNTIAIKERTNPRLQMQYMPKKYWQDLIEKQ